jgi:hypothetical protein
VQAGQCKHGREERREQQNETNADLQHAAADVAHLFTKPVVKLPSIIARRDKG